MRRGKMNCGCVRWKIIAVLGVLLTCSAAQSQQSHSTAERNDDTITIPLRAERLCAADLADLTTTSQSSELVKALLEFCETDRNLAIPVEAIELATAISNSTVHVERDVSGRATSLQISKRSAVQASNQWKNSLFHLFGPFAEKSASQLVPIADTWESASLRAFEERVADPPGSSTSAASLHDTLDRLLVVIPGYRSQAQDAVAFARKVHSQAGLPTCVFYYPTSVQIEVSGTSLAEHLLRLQHAMPNTELILCGHSMGGLIARYAIEMPVGNDVHCVQRILQIFPPNQGSILAELTEPGDAVQLTALAAKSIGKKLATDQSPQQTIELAFGLMLDGFGGASRDLRPGSPLLIELNSRPRRSDISYTIIAGNHGPISPVLALLNTELLSRVELGKFDRLAKFTPVVSRYANSEELTQGTGDGAVAIDSTYLAGVPDHLIIDSNHFEWALDSKASNELVRIVVKRIADSK